MSSGSVLEHSKLVQLVACKSSLNHLCICVEKNSLSVLTIIFSWTLVELRVMEVMVTIGAIRCAKHYHQQTNAQHFTGGMPFLSPNQQCQSTKWKYVDS